MAFFSLSPFLLGFMASVVLSNIGDQTFNLSTDIRIIETPERFQSDLGEVNGVTSCGGPAVVIDWRYESCSGKGICQAPADGADRRGEVTFVSSESIPGGLGVRVNATAPYAPSRIYEVLIPESAVRAGRSYTIFAMGSPGKEFKGKPITLQYIIFRQVDKFVEACAQTHVQNV